MIQSAEENRLGLVVLDSLNQALWSRKIQEKTVKLLARTSMPVLVSSHSTLRYSSVISTIGSV